MRKIYSGVIAIGLFLGLVSSSVFAVHSVVNSQVTQNLMSNAYSCNPENTSRFALYEGDNFRLWNYFYPVEYQNGNNTSLEGTREIQDTTNINVYNPYNALGNTESSNTLGGRLSPFYYMSNGRLGTRRFSNIGNGIANVLVSSQYAGVDYAVYPSTTPSRSQLAAQVMHNIVRRQVQSWCSWPYIGCASEYTMTSFDLDDEIVYTNSVRPLSYRGNEEGNTCQNFYIAKCGDGIVDIAGNAPNNPQDGEGGLQTDAGFVSWLLGDFQTEQCDDGNNINGDGCGSSCVVEDVPSSCNVNIQEERAYVYGDGSFDPNPIRISYNIDSVNNTTIETNIPGVQNHGNAIVNITDNLQDNYYIRILGLNGNQVAQCSDTISLGSCGDDELQIAYEQCEVNTQIMPANGVVNNLEALLPNFFDYVGNNKIGGVYAKLFNKNKADQLKVTDFDVRSDLNLNFQKNKIIKLDYGDIKQPIPSDLDGCSDTCQLETPTCNIQVGPGEINAGDRAYFSGQTQSWATFISLDFDEGGPTYDFANLFPGGLPVTYFYFDSGVHYDGYDNPELGYSYVARVENARGMLGSRQLLNPNIVIPDNICGGDTSINETLLDVEKSLLQENVVFMSGDNVGFQIIVSNNSNNWVHGLFVTDYFSPLLEWDGNIDIVGLGNNTLVTTGIIPGDPDLEWITVSNIDLTPMSSGVIYLTGRMYSEICNWPNTGVMTGDSIDEAIWFGASFSCGPVAFIEKFQSTGTSIDSFTQDLINVEIGDSLNYRIEFVNGGGSVANDVVVGDYLPAGITYVGSEIFVYTGGVEVVPVPLYTEQGSLGNQDYIIYSGFSLESEQSGYMMIYGEVSSNMNYVRYENTTNLEFTNPYQSGISNTVIAVRGGVPLVDFQKNIVDYSGNILSSGDNMPYFFSGNEIRFEISIENLGDSISGIILDDVWPDLDQNCVVYSGWESADAGRSWATGTWRWTYTPTLFEGYQTAFTLVGEVVGGSECVGTYTNTGLLYYYQSGTLYTGEADAIFDIRDANMLLTKTVDSIDVSVGSEIIFFLYFENNSSHTINNFVLRDLRPATLALQPSLTHPKPYTYIGPGNPSFTPPQAIDGGRELQRNRGNQEFSPGMTGMVILTGIVLDASEAIRLYEETH